ncbi:16S rRNA (uracil(1498)-N(3))-methyltransferase [Winogradskyella ouciana]|uniref:Ribosomal RNA small subunit methyltransferase E n=1 Tax=Winogradskyella ouciana TaxID=2608631 RepID=A0A7K1GAU8_9FLAO|nr:16S rRNA (uracil(1498)-N(3))-methyltransferase [Winogradskyella ouciana]MTE25508.1 16S rRNA (uracil(1498)-N(3))-methyltransferase [Winogradskyella ouciana]
MQLFYNPNISENDSVFSFDKDESRHIVKVLRKKVGDQLHITNGKGWLFEAELISADAKHCSVDITSKSLQPKRNFHLHLAVAPTKMNDRYEWFLEKATEIGIEEITPIICDNSERKVVKLERFERIIQSAMKQSLQCYLPKLNAPMSFQDFVNQEFSGQKFIAHCEETDKKSLKSELKTNEDCIVLIGPEGDFSVKEIEMALAANYIPVTLGDTRLRTETAAITACHSIAFVNG